MGSSTIVQTMIITLCALGCSYQLNNIVGTYLSYPLMNKVFVGKVRFFQMLDMTICIKYADIFNYEDFKAKENNRISKYRGPDDLKNRDDLFQLTLKQLMKYTPNGSDIIERSWFRIPDSYPYTPHDKASTDKIFDATKFFVQEFICYKINAKNMRNAKYGTDIIGNTINYQSTLYTVSMNLTLLGRANRFKIFFSDFDTYPDVNGYFAMITSRNYDHKLNAASDNYVKVSYSKVFKQRLPAPYRTDCINYKDLGMSSRLVCYRDCITNSSIRLLKLVPFQVISL